MSSTVLSFQADEETVQTLDPLAGTTGVIGNITFSKH